MLSKELVAEVRRLYYAEHWKVGTIASELGLHHTTVRRALGCSSVVVRHSPGPPRRSPTKSSFGKH